MSAGDCKGWSARGSGYKCHFLNWLEEPSYRIPLTEEQERELLGSLDKDLEEDKLYEEGVLTAEQLAFRRHTILEEYDWGSADVQAGVSHHAG